MFGIKKLKEEVDSLTAVLGKVLGHLDLEVEYRPEKTIPGKFVIIEKGKREGKFVCEECGFEAKSAGGLGAHKRVHK